ncbi:hypothetical protein C8R46DRAFT_1216918 [Mycena filopes]|nr:hypothetical protein C8R46DRAFT_1216918 [Mycena filopes]
MPYHSAQSQKDKRGPKQGKTQENPGTPVELDRRKLTPSRPEELVKAEPKITGRQSDIQSSVHLPAIVKRLLDLEIPLTVREVLVASKEIRNEIQDVIRLKNVKAVLLGHDSPLIANWAWPRSEGVLIRVEMEIGGRRVVAIVDTGSQLDVVRADVAALVLHRPVDMTRVTNMNDANGGRGQLRGFINDVELACGSVLTRTSLWVSQQAPFALLLGRPWQRNNLVTIDERDEGTYLVFKDRETRQPRYELLAIPHEATTEVLSFETDRQVLSFAIDAAGPTTKVPDSNSLAVKRVSISDTPLSKIEHANVVSSATDRQVLALVTDAAGPTDNIQSVDSLDVERVRTPDTQLTTIEQANLIPRPKIKDLHQDTGRTWLIWERLKDTGLEVAYLIQIWTYIGLLLGGRILLWLENSIGRELGYKRSGNRVEQSQRHAPIEPDPTLTHPNNPFTISSPPFPNHPSRPTSNNPEPMGPNRPASPTEESVGINLSLAADIQHTIDRLERDEEQKKARTLDRKQVTFGLANRPPLVDSGADIRCAVNTQQRMHEHGDRLHIRPAMAESVQTIYLGKDTVDGQETHRCIMLNARLLIHDPATGMPGVRTGHLYGKLLAAPIEADADWPLEVPCVSHQDVQAALRGDTEHHGWKVMSSPFAEPIWLTHSTKAIRDVQNAMKEHAPRPSLPSIHSLLDGPNLQAPVPIRLPTLRNVHADLGTALTPHRRRPSKFTEHHHYLIHPRDMAPPFDSTTMTRVGTTPSGDVVLRIQGKSRTIGTPERRTRPDTPRPPLVATTEQPALAEITQAPAPEDRQPDGEHSTSESGSDDDDVPELVAIDAGGATSEMDISSSEDEISAGLAVGEVRVDDNTPYHITNALFERVNYERRCALKRAAEMRGGAENDIQTAAASVDAQSNTAAATEIQGDAQSATEVLGDAQSNPAGNEEDADHDMEEEGELEDGEIKEAASPHVRSLGTRSADTVTDVRYGRLISRAHYSSSPSIQRSESTADFPPYDEPLNCEAFSEYCIEDNGAAVSVVLHADVEPTPIDSAPPTSSKPHTSELEYRDPAAQPSDESDPDLGWDTHSTPDPWDLRDLLYPADFEQYVPRPLESSQLPTPPASSDDSPANTTDGSQDAVSEAASDGFVVVDTGEIVAAMNHLHHRGPSPESDENHLAVVWAKTHRWVDESRTRQARENEAEFGFLSLPLQRAIRCLDTDLHRLTDRVAMARENLRTIDGFARLYQADQEIGDQIRRDRLVSIFIDDEVLWVADSDKMRADADKMDLASRMVAPGKRKVRDDPLLPPSRDGKSTRTFSRDAHQRSVAHRAAIAMEVLDQPTLINNLTAVREDVTYFIRQASNAVARRHWTYDLAALHEPSHVPLPFLFGDEYAKLRLIHDAFEKNDQPGISGIIDELMGFRFRDPEEPLPLLKMMRGWLVEISKLTNGHDTFSNMDLDTPFVGVIRRAELRCELPPNTVTCIAVRGPLRWYGRARLPRDFTQLLPLVRGRVVIITRAPFGSNDTHRANFHPMYLSDSGELCHLPMERPEIFDFTVEPCTGPPRTITYPTDNV